MYNFIPVMVCFILCKIVFVCKLLKSVGKSEHGCCDHKTSRNTTAEMRKIFVSGRGGAGYLQIGRLRIRKKKKKWGRRVSAGGHIFTFFDEIGRAHV